MSDLTERLRKWEVSDGGTRPLLNEAADEIEKAEARYKALIAEIQQRDRQIERMQQLLGKATLERSFREQLDAGEFQRKTVPQV